MKKFIAKVLFFLGFFLLLIIKLSDYFIERKIDYFTFDQYKKIDKNIDIAIFGSSHAYATYDPRILEVKTGLTAFNYGSALQNTNTTEFLIKNIINENSLKLIVVDIFSESIKEIIPENNFNRNFQVNVLDNYGFSLNKIRTFKNIGEPKIINTIPLFRNHSKWKTLFTNKDYSLSEDVDYYNGFHTSFAYDEKIWKKHEAGLKKNKYKDNIRKSLNDKEKAGLKKLLTIAKTKNIPILFVCSPFFQEIRGKQTISYQKLIKDFLVENKADYIDFNEYWESLKLNKWHFVDPDHLNSKGALKVSSLLADYILKNYINVIRKEVKKVSKNNRYLIINNRNESGNIKKIEIKDSTINNKLYVERVYFYKVFSNRYEILIEGKKNELKTLNTCLEYKTQKGGVNSSVNIVKKCKWLHGYLEYENNNYLTYQVDLDLKKIKDFKIFIGPNKDKLLINIPEFTNELY
ncbi:hypothetical protein [Winogradskyella undariae]|uniref:hypothetical protein n=1 Tax=Winogradskyella undariae TaxID=1285465 RepID=UPI0015CAA776|nr:hypothetical protein [Winogradskyella undariae]